jgi:hypothetical protein
VIAELQSIVNSGHVSGDNDDSFFRTVHLYFFKAFLIGDFYETLLGSMKLALHIHGVIFADKNLLREQQPFHFMGSLSSYP